MCELQYIRLRLYYCNPGTSGGILGRVRGYRMCPSPSGSGCLGPLADAPGWNTTGNSHGGRLLRDWSDVSPDEGALLRDTVIHIDRTLFPD